MADIDAVSLARRACMIGLVTESQTQECLEDAEYDPGDPESLLRIMKRKSYLSSWQSEKLLKGDKDGYFVGGFRLLYKISSGSFGRVYRAEDPRSGRVVAVKILRHRWSDNPQSVELFEREGKIGQTLKHPNIVEILAMARDPVSKQHYIVMEFIEGGNLKDFLAIRKKLEVNEALRLIEDAASGLAYAYSKGLTHRDLKPSNMLISSQGAIKLVDFGLAGFFTSTGTPEDDAKLERTVDYAGLEKATNVRTGDVRSDIYFLGCVLYEMLTGRPPLVVTRDKAARMQKERFDKVLPMSPAEVRAPPSVFRLVQTMMALEPLQRFQTPNQLVDGIRAARRDLVAGGGGGGGPQPVVEQPVVHRSIFVVEQSQKLQDAIREKFKELGYRVLLSTEPDRAMQRFRQQPYDALIIDAGSIGATSLDAFRHVVEESERRKHECACVLILSEDQKEWVDKIVPSPRVAILIRPVTLRQLHSKVTELLANV